METHGAVVGSEVVFLTQGPDATASPLYTLSPQPFLRPGKLTSLSKYIPAASFPPAWSALATHSYSFTEGAVE